MVGIEQTKFIQADLRKVTLKELILCLRSINSLSSIRHKLATGGKKEDVITRLTTFITNLVSKNDNSNIEIVVNIVNNSFSKKVQWTLTDGQLQTMHRAEQKKLPQPPPPVHQQVLFKKSPFFAPIIKLTPFQLVPASQDRTSKYLHFALNEDHRKMLSTGHPTDGKLLYELRFYCCKVSHQETSDVSVEFPNVCEIRINGNVIGGNVLRGIKNKPGTVNPPDLTILIRKGEVNSIEFVYYNTTAAYLCALYIVQRTPAAVLVQEMIERQISKEEVIKRFQEKQEEDEVVLESETLSMKCPLAFIRIVTPIRSANCNHLQCFDATTFLTMNEQTPTWSCPVCYRIIDCQDLVLDGYFLEILKKTPKHIENVKVEPDGRITVIDERESDTEDASDSEKEQEQVVKEIVELLDDEDEANIPYTESSEEPLLKKQKTDVIDLTLSDED